MGVGEFLAPISETLGQGHLATEAGRKLPCSHDKVTTADPITPSDFFVKFFVKF